MILKVGGASGLALEQLVERERIRLSVVINSSKFRLDGWNWHETWSGMSMPDPDPDPEPNGKVSGLSPLPIEVVTYNLTLIFHYCYMKMNTNYY